MKRYLIFIHILLFYACKQSLTKVIDRYPDGQTKAEYVYTNKKDTSVYVCNVYYENGLLKHKVMVANDMFVGEKLSFFGNGKIERSEKLFNPVPLDAELYDCYVINYYSNGTKESEYQYLNNKLNGLVIDYDSLGNKIRTAKYVDGKMNGKEIIYFPGGSIKSWVECRNDSAYGYEYEFSETGDTLKANIHYGESDNGIFYKKWLKDGRLLVGSYGDKNRYFVIWKWYDQKRGLLKSVIDKGMVIDSNANRFIAPE